ncbi:hypothetical protein FCV25MIE_29545 [Fagus crenata]
MANDLVEEWRNFSLTENEALGLTIEDDAMGSSKAMGSHALLGKLLTEKYFNKEAFKATMLRLWGVSRGITVQGIGDNLFVFNFKDEFERCRVQNGSPWLFDNYLLMLKEFDGSCPASQIQFSHCSFWVQLHGVPLFYMTKQTGERIGNTVGSVVEVDVPESGVSWGLSLRVRLYLDVTKPIPRGRMVTFKSLGQMWVSFRYERLPWICFLSGILGHLERDCIERLRSGFRSTSDSKQYGPWLRATEFQQRCRATGGVRSRQGPSPLQKGDEDKAAANLIFKVTRCEDISEGSNCSASDVHMQDKGGVSSNIELQRQADIGGCSFAHMRDTTNVPKIPPLSPLSNDEDILVGCYSKKDGILKDEKIVGTKVVGKSGDIQLPVPEVTKKMETRTTQETSPMGLGGAPNTTTIFPEFVVVSSLSTPYVEGSKWHGDKLKSNAAQNEVLLPTSVQGDKDCAINVANVEEYSGPTLRKKTWKRLARAKGNSSNGG